jgi:hypothetical protein
MKYDPETKRIEIPDTIDQTWLYSSEYAFARMLNQMATDIAKIKVQVKLSRLEGEANAG